MDYIRLGDSGLQVSATCLGCYGFGDPRRGRESWTLPAAESIPLLRRAMESGITFFDTANGYSAGHSEELLGQALADFGERESMVIATKVWAAVRPGPNGAGLSRKAILTEVDASLRRLGLDYIDLYQIHRFDPHTPVEETMHALHTLVTSGKVRYLGASSMPAWQFAGMQHVADLAGLTRFVSMQDHYNLLYREAEREMLPLCAAEGVGVLSWSPLARGLLARPAREQTARVRADPYVDTLYDEAATPIIDAVGHVAQQRGVPRARIALAWVCQHSAVTAPVVGISRPSHLDDLIAASDIRLTDEEQELLTRHYRPRPAHLFG